MEKKNTESDRSVVGYLEIKRQKDCNSGLLLFNPAWIRNEIDPDFLKSSFEERENKEWIYKVRSGGKKTYLLHDVFISDDLRLFLDLRSAWIWHYYTH